MLLEKLGAAFASGHATLGGPAASPANLDQAPTHTVRVARGRGAPQWARRLVHVAASTGLGGGLDIRPMLGQRFLKSGVAGSAT